MLKLIDSGLPKDDIMILNTALYAIKFIMLVFVTKYVTGQKQMSFYLKVEPLMYREIVIDHSICTGGEKNALSLQSNCIIINMLKMNFGSFASHKKRIARRRSVIS